MVDVNVIYLRRLELFNKWPSFFLSHDVIRYRDQILGTLTAYLPFSPVDYCMKLVYEMVSLDPSWLTLFPQSQHSFVQPTSELVQNRIGSRKAPFGQL